MSPSDYETQADLDLATDDRRRGDRGWLRGHGRWFAVGLAIAFATGIVVLISLSRTEWGRDQVLEYTLSALGGRLNGDLTVVRLEGNLITGARLYEIRLDDTTGVPLAVIDSAFIRYRLATLTGGDVVINRLDVYGADINIFRLHGDTLWNYQGVFQDPTPDPVGDPTATLVENLRLYETDVTIRMPLVMDARLPEARQEQELAMILADTARWMTEETPEGYLRTNLMDIAGAEVAELFIGPDERGGIFLEVVDVAAEVRLWLEPALEIRGAQAQLHLQEGILSFDAPNVVLPNSGGSSVGRIDLRGERPLYDVVITTPAFALSDIRFLYPWLPEDPSAGRGSGRLWVEDKPDGLLVVARDVVLDMPDTHITGRFGIIVDPVSDTLRFVDVDLEAEPLRVESVERLLPEDLPVEGLVIGGATIRGS